MSLTLAFDIYGTLIDPHGVVVLLEDLVGASATDVSNTWRQKQLEYTFRRGLMRRYEGFAACTRDALDYACELHALSLCDAQKRRLLEAYSTLPAFDDVAEGLDALRAGGHRLFAFSNGGAEAVDGLLAYAGLRDRFDGIVSVDEVQSFKPDPAVYRHLLGRCASQVSDTWLVSSNPFDVLGALNAGLRAAWVRRSATAVFDPWGEEPTLSVESLETLPAALDSFEA